MHTPGEETVNPEADADRRLVGFAFPLTVNAQPDVSSRPDTFLSVIGTMTLFRKTVI